MLIALALMPALLLQAAPAPALLILIALASLLLVAVFDLRKAGVRGPRLAIEVVAIVVCGVAFWIFGRVVLSIVLGFPEPLDALLGALIAIAAAAAWVEVRKRQAASAVRPVASTPEAASPQPASPASTLRRGIVFISYRRADSSDVTGRIYDRLADRFGRERVFKDVDSIVLGVDFREGLTASVTQCRVLVAVIGPRWSSGADAARQRPLENTGDYVRIEIESALQRGIPVIPVLVQGARIPSLDQLPASLQPLAYRNGIAVRPDPDFHTDMDRLIRGIEAHI